jgi:hypothetical protein
MYEFPCDNNLCLTTTTFVNGMDETRMKKSFRFYSFFLSPSITGAFPTHKYSKSENGWVVIFGGIVIVDLES